MDPTNRLTIKDLAANVWIQGESQNSSTPLMTPGVLNSNGVATTNRMKATMNAFHRFLLMDVSNAPLAKRRKRKKDSSTETRSSSGESVQSQGSSQGNGFVNPNCVQDVDSGDFQLNSIPPTIASRLANCPSSESSGFSPQLPFQECAPSPFVAFSRKDHEMPYRAPGGSQSNRLFSKGNEHHPDKLHQSVQLAEHENTLHRTGPGQLLPTIIEDSERKSSL